MPHRNYKAIKKYGFGLDVGCGINANLTKFGITTPVGLIPNAYGIDSVLEFVSDRHAVKDKTFPAYAEDMPFKDVSFDFSFSSRGVGVRRYFLRSILVIDGNDTSYQA